MRWPWSKQREALNEAREERTKAEQREQDIQPLVRNLHQHDRRNHLSARVRVAFGGRPR